MKRAIATLTISSLVMISGTATRAQDGPPEYGMPISAQQASAVAAAAVETMAENGWRMAVSVVDPAGHLVHFEKVDGTQNASIEISMRQGSSCRRFQTAHAGIRTRYRQQPRPRDTARCRWVTRWSAHRRGRPRHWRRGLLGRHRRPG